MPARFVILVLTIWALCMIVPDMVRPFQPLGSIGVDADNDGRIISVAPGSEAERDKIVPFGENEAGDSIDLKLTPRDDLIEVFGGLGGMQYLPIGKSVTLDLLRPDGTPFPHPITLTASIAPLPADGDVVLELDQILGVGFILLAAFLVWTYPRRSTLGFFLFAIWFNPGQYFEFYAHLSPSAMIVQEIAQAIFEAAGVVGFLEFALRFPTDKVEGWRATVEKLVPVIFLVLAALGLSSFGAEIGIHSELASRLAYGAAYLVYPLVVYAFITKLSVLSPEDALRLRWVIAGCIPGLFFFILVDSIESTSMWQWLWDRLDWYPPETWLNLGYMVNSLVAISVGYAVIRQRVLPIAFLINRSLVLGTVGIVLTSAVEGLLVLTHSIIEHHHVLSTVLAGLLLAGLAPLIGRFEHKLNHTIDEIVFRSFHEARKHLVAVGETLASAASVDGVDERLVNAPCDVFGIASAAIFRVGDDASFAQSSHARGWAGATAQFAVDDPLVLHLREYRRSVRLTEVVRNNADLPAGAAFPSIAIPLVCDRDIQAIALYGGHDSGTDLSPDEISCLEALVAAGSAAYEHLRNLALQRQIETLRRQLARTSNAPANAPARAPAT